MDRMPSTDNRELHHLSLGAESIRHGPREFSRESALDASSVSGQAADVPPPALLSRPQGTYSPHGANYESFSPAHSIGGHSASDRSQTGNLTNEHLAEQSARVRPTPASNFSALFPPPQAVASVTTDHSSLPPQNLNSSASYRQSLPQSAQAASSRRSPLVPDRYHPYSHPSGPSATPSLSHSVSSSASHSLVSSRPSSRAVSASGLGSPSYNSHSASFPASNSHPSFSWSDTHSWPQSQPSSSTARAHDHQSTPSNGLVLPSYSSRQIRTASSDAHSTNPSYYTFEGERHEESRFANDDAENKNRSVGFIAKQEPEASPQLFGHGFVHDVAPLSQHTNSVTSVSTAGFSDLSYFERNLNKGPIAGTRGLLAPYAISQQNVHQPIYTVPAQGAASYRTTMNGNMYQADVDLDPMESYEDDDILGNLPHGSGYDTASGFSMGTGNSASKKDEKQVRRRSSKACDQCRKSKCKCERNGEGEACKSCVMLGTACTFLGPSRKRGPPKGYIDAIESRLHQTEALVGIILSLANPERSVLDGEDPVPDERARSLIEDLRNNDPLAREIVNRVDRGAYGTKGRKSNATLSADLKRRSGSGSGDEKGSSSGGTTTKEGSKTPASTGGMGAPPASIQGRGRMVGLGQEMEMSGLATAHPSNEWQDAVTERLKVAAKSRNANSTASGGTSQTNGGEFERERQRRRVESQEQQSQRDHSPEQFMYPQSSHRQSISSTNGPSEPANTLTVATSAARFSPPAAAPFTSNSYSNVEPPPSSSSSHSSYIDSAADEPEQMEGEEGITGGVGQLSINEEAQVRFHGKASGLYLLGRRSRVDGRNKGGIWHFPPARVWPPVAPSPLHIARQQEAEACERAARARLPSREVQEHLLQLYFTHVHPFLPIIHKKTFMEDFKKMHEEFKQETSGVRSQSGGSTNAASPESGRTGSEGLANGDTGAPASRVPRIPTLLLLAMFAIAARYAPVAHGTTASPNQVLLEPATVPENTRASEESASHNSGSRTASPEIETDTSRKEDADAGGDLESDDVLPDPNSGHMWAAGDGFLERAKDLLDRTYASSRPSTCQALILMGYREIGIGAMAQSWLYIGMAVRMAQDLGMHRNSETWIRDGEPIFSPVEQQIRKRIWYACVIMDKYVSTYIGRPLSIFEADYDTRLPSIDEDEESELWAPNETMPNSILTDPIEVVSAPLQHFDPVPGRIISCFNDAARLSSILAMIIQAIYAVNPVSSRHFEALQLERTLDRWYMDLPKHLRFDPNARTSSIPPPNVLILHMQYWCVVILLHRPFIPQYIAMHQKRLNPENSIDQKTYSAAQKNFNLCVSAANHITAIVSIYQEHFCLKRCPAFLTYYIFTAGIMHVTTMATNPDDPQSSLGLNKCMEVLKRIEIVWPSAARAWELLHGAKDDLPSYEPPSATTDRPKKRSADDPIDTVILGDPSHLHAARAAALSGPSPFAPTAVNGQRYDPIVDITDSSRAFSLFNSYSRWESESDGSVGFPSGLSTSVLPQQYSTGFIDDRLASGALRTPTGSDGSGRFPQYWGDITIGHHSSMLGSMYDLPPLTNLQTHVQQSQHASQSSHAQGFQGAQSLYLNDQYNAFNPPPPS